MHRLGAICKKTLDQRATCSSLDECIFFQIARSFDSKIGCIEFLWAMAKNNIFHYIWNAQYQFGECTSPTWFNFVASLILLWIPLPCQSLA